MAEEKTELTEQKEKGLKAKTASLIGKIVGGLTILLGHVFKWIGFLPGATSGEIITCGFSIMACFGTVDINLMLDKFLKKEGQCVQQN